ncbi:phosphotransferase [Inquilinus limosus]
MDLPPIGRLLGSGKEAEVFDAGALAVKLYRTTATAPKRAAFREAAVLALVESLDLPVPSVRAVGQIDGRWGIAMTRAEGPSFADAMQRRPEEVPACLQRMVRLQMDIHGHPGTHLGSLKARLAANIGRVGMLDEILKRRLLDGLSALPEGDRAVPRRLPSLEHPRAAGPGGGGRLAGRLRRRPGGRCLPLLCADPARGAGPRRRLY